MWFWNVDNKDFYAEYDVFNANLVIPEGILNKAFNVIKVINLKWF